MAIVKITFQDTSGENGRQFRMLFGSSYKTWQEQFSEYVRSHPELRMVCGFRSGAEWIGYGGLKWCAEDEIQAELDKEGKGLKKKPRQYASFVWEPLSFAVLLKARGHV